MTLSLADLDKWDPDAIREVFAAVTGHSQTTRHSSQAVGQVMASVPWEGEAYRAAAQAASGIQQDLRLHADQLDAVAAAASIAESEVRGIKADWQKICRMADRWGILIDINTSEIVPPSPPPSDPSELAALERRMDIIHDEIVDLLGRASDADRDLAAAINGATGHMSAADVRDELQDGPHSQGSGLPYERKFNEAAAFRELFGRDPATANDWVTAAALDPHSYNPKNIDVSPKIVVGRIEPVPGQGVVRSNLFIPGKDVWAPSLDSPLYDNNVGDNRGFSPTAGPEDSRVAIYTDFDNGVIVARQNPSINADTGQVRTGTPSVSALQQPNGSVLIKYNAADPFSPGGEDLAKAIPISVNGEIAIAPTADGPRVGAHITTFPAFEVYNERDGRTVPILQSWPTLFDNAAGPLTGLPFSKEAGEGLILTSFNSVIPQLPEPAIGNTGTDIRAVPITPPMAILPPGNLTPLGPITSSPQIRVYTPLVGGAP